jgi:hypothetical protein
MVELIGIYLLPGLIVACVAEILLFVIRKRKGVSMAYVVSAALVRGLAYSPCAVGIGHGGAVLPLVLGLGLAASPSAEIYTWKGVPAIALAVLSFGLSCARHRARLFNPNERA